MKWIAYYHLLIRVFVVIVICVVMSWIAGCATKTQIIYKAIRCDIDLPARPSITADRIENLREILIYSNELEARLKACKGVKE